MAIDVIHSGITPTSHVQRNKSNVAKLTWRMFSSGIRLPKEKKSVSRISRIKRIFHEKNLPSLFAKVVIGDGREMMLRGEIRVTSIVSPLGQRNASREPSAASHKLDIAIRTERERERCNCRFRPTDAAHALRSVPVKREGRWESFVPPSPAAS